MPQIIGVPGGNYAELSKMQEQQSWQRKQQKAAEDEQERRKRAELTQAIASSFMQPRGGGAGAW